MAAATSAGSLSTTQGIKCVWFPTYEEFGITLEKYFDTFTSIYHIVHITSLRKLVESLFVRLNQQALVDPSHVALLLSIVASVTIPGPLATPKVISFLPPKQIPKALCQIHAGSIGLFSPYRLYFAGTCPGHDHSLLVD
jgi:hypothetical protein